MNPYLEIHQTLDDFEQALFSNGGATDFDALHHEYDEKFMYIVKKAEIEALNHALEYMGQFPDFNLANMYEYIKDKKRENIENGEE